MFVSRPPNQTTRPTALAVVSAMALAVAGISMRGLLFSRPHRLLPSSVRLSGMGFCMTTLFFVVAGLVRRCVIEGHSVGSVVAALCLAYAVLMLVSVANRGAEFTICLSISAGIDAVGSILQLAGLVDLGDPAWATLLLGWELAAGFVALLQLSLHRMPRPRNVPDADQPI